MSQLPISLTQVAARRFLVNAFALNDFQAVPTVVEVVRKLEFVQEDSINVCGRIHDLILWARVAQYRPSDLHDVLYGTSNDPTRYAFEYYFPNLCVLPIEDYPYFVRAMRTRENGVGRWHALTEEEQTVAEKLLTHLDTHGPLRTRQADKSDGHTTSGWGMKQAISSRVMEKLWLHGHLMVAKRQNFERWFDRPSRSHPPVSAVSLPHESDETAHLIRKRLRARRLFRRPRPADVTAVGGEDALLRVLVEGDARPWFALREDTDALQAATQTRNETDEKTVHLLAPLDPLVYDRQRLQSVWNFDYVWEVYTPQPKRKWGYYVMPILRGDDLVGRLDSKIDRKTGVFHVHSLRLEPDAQDKADAVAAPLAERLQAFATFLGASRIDLNVVEPDALRAKLTALL